MVSLLTRSVDCCDDEVKNRFTYQKRFRDKVDMLAYHAEHENSVIVAPAMHEGINLIDDLSRFQIVCKTPYPNFYEDKQLTRRMEIDERYYSWLTALKLIQSVGRSVRSNTDWADTYIIDEAVISFIQRNRQMIPDWFLEAIR